MHQIYNITNSGVTYELNLTISITKNNESITPINCLFDEFKVEKKGQHYSFSYNEKKCNTKNIYG